jgi:hypothetical protein
MADTPDRTMTGTPPHPRPVTRIVNSARLLEGGGFDSRRPWCSPLRGASNFAPGEIVRFVDRTRRVLAS